MRAPICAWYGPGYYENPDPPKPAQPEPEPEPKPKPSPSNGKKDRPEPPGRGPKRAGAREPAPVSARHALILGKFLPLHAGHEYLVGVARALAETTTLLARVRPADPIAPELRLAWLRELFGARVGALDGPDPADSAGAPAFWHTWRDHVISSLARLPEAPKVDLVVSSDREAWRLAELFGARHVLVDPDRAVVPISSSAIRRDPLAAWPYLPPPVRAHYARRVVLLGPESSGKSTFARALAAALDTVYVPEQARLFAERCGGQLREVDLPAIADLQAATEDAAARRANRCVIADTDALSLRLWAERLFGRAPALPVRVPDVYLVTDASLPFAGPAERDDPAARRAFAARCLAEARASGARVALLPSDPAARLEAALAALRR
ncbi:MAG TPA: AAA family ATPase [Kofleriaceae bacterium]|nr:AAA family ATPase [Kofleriaceae bacterium]